MMLSALLPVDHALATTVAECESFPFFPVHPQQYQITHFPTSVEENDYNRIKNRYLYYRDSMSFQYH